MTTSCIENVNMFQPTNFRVTIDRKQYGSIEFFAQQVTHPGMNSGPAPMSAPRVTNIPMPGDTLAFDGLNMQVFVDEDFNAYREIYSWMLRNINQKHVPASLRTASLPTSAHDVVVTALSSHNNKTIQFRYKDCVPVGVGTINFDASQGNVQYITFDLQFAFTYFEII